MSVRVSRSTAIWIVVVIGMLAFAVRLQIQGNQIRHNQHRLEQISNDRNTRLYENCLQHNLDTAHLNSFFQGLSDIAKASTLLTPKQKKDRMDFYQHSKVGLSDCGFGSKEVPVLDQPPSLPPTPAPSSSP